MELVDGPQLQPVEIELDRAAALRIRWADGHVSQLPLAAVRRACPCATCREMREQEQAVQNPLRVLRSDTADMATAETAELVGHYALRIRWRDGHDTGIYEYRRLRELDAELGKKR